MNPDENGNEAPSRRIRRARRLRGIVVSEGPETQALPAPRIAAFIWGGRVPASPTLPFGRWKGAA